MKEKKLHRKKLIAITIISINTVLILLYISACKNENTKPENYQKKSVELQNFKFKFDFPDTVYANKIYDGNLLFESVFDTITEDFDDTIHNRYAYFSMAIVDDIYSEKYLRTIAKDTRGSINNRRVPLLDIKFNKLGVNYIDGIFNDHSAINLNKKDSNGDDLFRYVEKEVRISHKVYVVEKAKNMKIKSSGGKIRIVPEKNKSSY